MSFSRPDGSKRAETIHEDPETNFRAFVRASAAAVIRGLEWQIERSLTDEELRAKAAEQRLYAETFDEIAEARLSDATEVRH
jgi:hypothetical protein